MNARTPVTVLTGFLGSGKTTLLRRWLQSPAMADAAVIVNEFGEVGLDHLLVERGEEDVVLLDSGCLCCAVSNSLAETLEDLHYRRLRGSVPKFSRVLIETSGLAEPAPIMHLLLADPGIVRWYTLDGVVTTVDAVFGRQELIDHPTSRKQAAVADTLVITKTDASDEVELARLEVALDAINASAPRLRAVNGDVDPDQLSGVGSLRGTDRVARWVRGDRPALGFEHRHPGDIESHVVVLHESVGWPDYTQWLSSLRRIPATKLLRVKGILALGPEGAPHVIQGVQHVFSHPAPLDAWPWADRRSRLVFIVQGLSRADIAETLAGRPFAFASEPA